VDASTVIPCYQLLAELLLYPEGRNEDRIQQLVPLVENAPDPVRKPLLELLANPEIRDCGAYLEELEMSRNRPLYLGFYLFDEPESCQSAGTCGRNGYMIELSGIYRHYGLELDGRELPDFLPLALDFLALSADRRQGDEGAVRTLLIERYLQPAVVAMHERFSEHGGPWLLAVDALAALLRAELDEVGAVAPTASDPLRLITAQQSNTECPKEMS
jgi:nitrate reductase delta subunit